MLVDQQPHQFERRQCRVGIVEVHRVAQAQVVQRTALAQVAGNDVLQRGADEQEFLLQAQLAAGLGAVVGVQHPVQQIRRQAVVAGRQVLAAAKGGEIDAALGAGTPLPQRGDTPRGMAGDDEIVGLRDDALGWHPASAGAGVVDVAAEADHVTQLRARNLPRVAQAQPVVWLFDLAAVFDHLREHAVLVAHAIAERGQAQRRERIEKTSRQAPQPAIAQGRVGFAFEHITQRLMGGFQRQAQFGVEVQRLQRIAERPAHQEFHRHVVDATRVLRQPILILRLDPAVGELLAAGCRRGAQCGPCRTGFTAARQGAFECRAKSLSGAGRAGLGSAQGGRFVHRFTVSEREVDWEKAIGVRDAGAGAIDGAPDRHLALHRVRYIVMALAVGLCRGAYLGSGGQ